MTKQEKIQEAYVDYWNDKIDQDGWCRLSISTEKKLVNHMVNNQDLFESRVITNPDCFMTYFRPLSLQGIENNNGWIKIESDDDLPKNSGDFWIINAYGSLIEASFLVNRKVFFKFGDIKATH